MISFLAYFREGVNISSFKLVSVSFTVKLMNMLFIKQYLIA